MGSKHGIWFDLSDHLTIHNKVIESYGWLIASGETKYRVGSVTKEGVELLTHDIKFITTNGYIVEIFKSTILSGKGVNPRLGLTHQFSYNCIHEHGDYKLQYHSFHSKVFNHLAPWHHLPHRHEIKGKRQIVDVYSHDDRPEKLQHKKYTWPGGYIELAYLKHTDWPFVSEFLDEVSGLENAI